MIKIAITGASGFLGIRACNLLEKKKNIIIIGAYNSKKIDAKKIIQKKLDIYKKNKNFFKFLNKPDIVIHLAWPDLNNFNSLDHLKKNLPAQKIFLENLIRNGLKNLLVTGTCFEYEKKNGKMHEANKTLPITNYGKSKNILREFLFSLKTKYKYNLTWARIFYMYGVNDKRETLTNILINSQKNQKYVVLNKNIKRDYLDVKEAAKKIINLSLKRKDFGIVNICSGKCISLMKLTKILKKKYKIKPLIKFKNMKDRFYESRVFYGDSEKFNRIIKLRPEV